MNYINNGEYYLVARYSDNDKHTIDLNRKWYYGTEDIMQTGVDIAAIDLVTTKFKSMAELKERLYKNKYIKDINVDLYIVHKNKFNDSEYLNEYELLFNNSERTKLINDISKNRLKSNRLEFNDINNFLNKFITKVFYTKSFSELITCPWIKIDPEIKNQLLVMNKNKTENSKPSYSLKYRNKGRFTSYSTVRNIISAWNSYDEIMKNYEKENPNFDDLEFSKVIINKYIDLLKIKDQRKEIKNELSPIVDKNNVKGQITMNEYLNNKQDDEYTIEMKKMYEEFNILKESEFDDYRLKALEQKYGRVNVIDHMNKEILKSIGPADSFRLGYIDYVTYKNSMRENNGKRYS